MDSDNEGADVPYDPEAVESEEEDEFPEFGNDENKKLFELVLYSLGRSDKRSATSRRSTSSSKKTSSERRSSRSISRMSTKNFSTPRL